MKKRWLLANWLLLLGLALLVLPVACAYAQSNDDRGAFYNTLRSVVGNLESVAPTGMVNPSNVAMPTLDTYDLNFAPNELLSLRRSFKRSALDNASLPLGVSFQENSNIEASLNLTSRTGLSFSSTDTEVKDIAGLVINSNRVNVMGLAQTFGAGVSASSLNLTRTVTTTSAALGVAKTTEVQALDFKTGLAKDTGLAVKASRTNNDDPRALQEQALQTVLNLKFSGGSSPLSFSTSQKQINGNEIFTEKADLAIPVAMRGSKAIAEYHSAYTLTNGVLNKLRTTHMMVPIGLLGQAGSVDYSIVGQAKGTSLSETRTAKFVNPFKIAGRTFGAEETLISLSRPDSTTDTLHTKFVAPLAGGQAVIQRQTVTVATSSGLTEQRQISVVLPTIKMDRMAVTAQRVSNEVVGKSQQEVTNVNVTAQPIKPLHIEARYQLNDRGLETEALMTRELHTKLAINKGTSLQGHLTEAEVAGASSNILRLVELVRDRGNSSGLGLRAGFASYGRPGAQLDDARRVEVIAGKPSALAISAAYSEYDVNSITPYGTDATVALALQHGDPSRFALRYRYEDQPTRIQPLKAVDVAMPALGGALTVSYQSNPMAPDGKTVRQADQWDATLGRKVFGAANLQLGYRYTDYNEVDNVDQNISIKLDSGKEAAGGKLTIAYLTGEFCTVKNAPLPGSMFDLTYSRTWGSSDRFNLTLSRRNPLPNSFNDSTTEARLEYNKNF